MSKVKILTSKVHRNGKPCIIGNQQIQFNDAGEAEVEMGQVEYLLGKDESLSLVKEEKKSGKAEGEKVSNKLEVVIDDLTKENIKLSEQVETLKVTITDLEIEIETLKGLGKKVEEEENPFLKTPLNECKELCKDAGYPEEEWSNLKVTAAREYLFTQYKKEQLGKTE
jgi:vacuolar-type H+-ATPase subunit I/STV1